MMRSGSHAIVDLLSEYDNIAITNGELDEFRAAGMVSDMLDDQMTSFWANSIDKYLANFNQKHKYFKLLLSKYVVNDKRLLKLLFKSEYLNARVKKVAANNELIKLNASLKQNLPVDEKIEIANGWIHSLGDIYSEFRTDVQYAVFDNPISTISDIEIFSRVFSPFKLICCIRDPRDQVANIIKDAYIHLPFGPANYNWGGMALETIYGRDRKDAIRLFVDLIMNNYKRLERYEKQIPKNDLMIVKFEDLVQNYEDTKADIEAFIGVDSGHHNKIKSSFIPEVSMKNIGYFQEYLTPDEIAIVSPLMEYYSDFKKGW